jgi:hypothetical protein
MLAFGTDLHLTCSYGVRRMASGYVQWHMLQVGLVLSCPVLTLFPCPD